MTYIQPRNDFILVERIEKPSGIIIATDADKSIYGKVLAVGPGKFVEGVSGDLVRRPLEVKPGDRVYFNSKWNNMGADYQHVSYNWDDKLHLVQEADVFGVISGS